MPGCVDKLWDLARADDGSTPGALADALRDGAKAKASAAKASAAEAPSAGPAAKRLNTRAKVAVGGGEGRAASPGWKAAAAGADAMCAERAEVHRARKNAKLLARERHVAGMMRDVAGIAGGSAAEAEGGKKGGITTVGTVALTMGAGCTALALQILG